MIDLNEMKIQSLAIAIKRGQEVGVLSSLKHCTGEVVEAADAWRKFEYQHGSVIGTSKQKNDFVSELADIVMCVLTICAREHLDIEQALKDCLKKNKSRITEVRKTDFVGTKLAEHTNEIARIKEQIKSLEKSVYKY